MPIIYRELHFVCESQSSGLHRATTLVELRRDSTSRRSEDARLYGCTNRLANLRRVAWLSFTYSPCRDYLAEQASSRQADNQIGRWLRYDNTGSQMRARCRAFWTLSSCTRFVRFGSSMAHRVATRSWLQLSSWLSTTDAQLADRNTAAATELQLFFQLGNGSCKKFTGKIDPRSPTYWNWGRTPWK